MEQLPYYTLIPGEVAPGQHIPLIRAIVKQQSCYTAIRDMRKACTLDPSGIYYIKSDTLRKVQ